jgi:xylan 1,4-beta-xylosidase
MAGKMFASKEMHGPSARRAARPFTAACAVCLGATALVSACGSQSPSSGSRPPSGSGGPSSGSSGSGSGQGTSGASGSTGGSSGSASGGLGTNTGGAGTEAGADSTTREGGAAVNCPAVDSTMGSGTARAVTVDAAQVIGTIRSLQGAHWNPGPANQALSQNYVAMGVDIIRTHDGGGVQGTGAGDVDGPGASRMVPSLTADPMLAASYNFGPTDSMLKNMRDAGAQIYFRVGRSNISGANTVPPDFTKYAQFVQHIVMHYNQGWASGFTYGIKYFEIWNEPDFLPFWAGTPDQYHDLYKTIALAIKATDSTALVGGPAISTFNDKTGLRATFLQYLKDNKVPLDFYSFHKYTNKSQDPMDYARMAQSYRADLDKYGFNSTQIVNSEFESSLEGDVMLGGEAGHAAFLADALIYMQNGAVDKATSYMTIGSAATKESLAFGAISKLNATPSRLCAQGGDDDGFGVIAGLAQSSPKLQVVIANYQISTSLMGPIPGGNEESLMGLATMTYLDRRTFTYPDKDGYALTVKSIPDSWGDVTVKQYRIDANNSFSVVNTKVFTTTDRAQGSLTVSGSWIHATASPPNDPKGAAQGLDLIVVTGAAAAQ